MIINILLIITICGGGVFMENIKEDRRIRRTKKLLKQALAQLMDEKDFKDITVKDITERADLNRGTFYLHYMDTYDILNKIEDEILKNIQNMIDQNIEKTNASDSVIPALKPIAEYIMENADICRCLINNKASVDFIEKFQNLIYDNCSDIIKRRHNVKDSKQNEFYLSFITLGIIGMVKKWLETRPMVSAEEIVVFVDQIMTYSSAALK